LVRTFSFGVSGSTAVPFSFPIFTFYNDLCFL
jgi:hypothetical protein